MYYTLHMYEIAFVISISMSKKSAEHSCHSNLCLSDIHCERWCKESETKPFTDCIVLLCTMPFAVMMRECMPILCSAVELLAGGYFVHDEKNVASCVPQRLKMKA